MILHVTLLFCFFCSNLSAKELVFNIFSKNNGSGLELDRKILTEELQSLGHRVNQQEFRDKEAPVTQADVNIHIEHITPSHLHAAPLNWYIPNPEWLDPSDDFSSMDLILCRTKEVERIFKQLKKKTYFLGFTSEDCYDPTVKKDFSKYLHLAGRSDQKGTGAIFQVWRLDPRLPHLTLIKWPSKKFQPFSLSNLLWVEERVETSELRLLQNSCGVHLAPSETEGFGHTLSEAMSTGAVVITTNAPPMNEFIMDTRCLVPFSNVTRRNFATKYHIVAAPLQKVIKKIIKLPPRELEKIGMKNRNDYLKRKKDFKARLEQLVNQK